MNLAEEKDYIKILSLEELYDLLQTLENKKATRTEEYQLVLEEIKGRK